MSAILEWHALSAPEVLARMESRPGGLSAGEAQARLSLHGLNELVAAAPPSPWALLARQFRNVLVLILLLAVALSLVLGHGLESVVIAVIVVFAVLLGFAQEYRAERALEALRALAAPGASVLRDGAEARVPAREVVPGDVLVLRTGDRVAADARLLEAVGLTLDEAMLTGESQPAEKSVEPLGGGARSPGDRLNMVFGGTAIAAGRGRAVVVATGPGTEFGRIAHLLGTIAPAPTPLQVSLDRVGAALAKVAVAVVAVVVVLGWIRGAPLLEMLLFGLALAVAVVPEALPAVVTISLALGVQRLARRNALVRRLPAAETLGAVTVICSDKTGTLTRDEMTVREVRVAEGAFGLTGAGYDLRGDVTRDGAVVAPPPSVRELLGAAALASDARLEPAADGSVHPRGDPTELAIAVAARKAGVDVSRLEAELPRVGERPFTPERKAMTTLHRGAGGTRAFTKGAPEVVLAMCAREATEGGARPCDPASARAWLEAAQAMAARAMRVLAVAQRSGAADAGEERGFTLLGLVGMMDPPRPEAREAVRRCASAGVKVVMITGDHPATARAVAREVGLAGGDLLTGAELTRLPDGELDARVEDVAIYARVAPADKLRVVEALQRRGHVLAMTGDGVNDAPALKRADIGIAMGRTGTDVSREAAAMVLTDDDFASIVGAVEEARIIFANVRKYLTYLLSSNAGEIGLMAVTTLLGLPLPLSTIMLLYVNLATDGLPALALAVDPPDEDVMQRPPRRAGAGVFTRSVVGLILVGGLWSTLVNSGLYAWAFHSGRPQAEVMTLSFVTLVVMELAKAFVFRSDRRSALRRPFTNRWLDAAVGWELLLLSAVVYLPPLQRALGTSPLPPWDLALALSVAVTVVPVVEVAKALMRRAAWA